MPSGLASPSTGPNAKAALTRPRPKLLAQRDLSDEKIQALVDKRTQAKRARNFALADQIRNELAEKGIVIEDSKDGVRWKRK